MEYAELLLKQGGACAVCLRAKDYDLYVDHCHSSGVVRGLLCATCNSMLGNLEDSKDALLRAVRYLDNSGAVALPQEKDG